MRLGGLRKYATLVATGLLVSGLTPLRSTANEVEGLEVTGRADPDNATRSFIWTITNTDRTPVMSFEAPAYLGGGLIVPPKGWEVTRKPGTAFGRRRKWEQVTFQATSPAVGVRRGHSMKFHVRIHADLRWQAIPETVVLKLEGDETVTFKGVRCPAPENVLRQFFPAIGLGAMFAIFLLVKLFRRGGKKKAAPQP